jgi:hypothetical protein
VPNERAASSDSATGSVLGWRPLAPITGAVSGSAGASPAAGSPRDGEIDEHSGVEAVPAQANKGCDIGLEDHPAGFAELWMIP